MNNMEQHQHNNINSDELDVINILRIIWSNKFYIAALTSLFALISILYVLSLPNVYKSHAVLLPSKKDSSIDTMLNQYSGLAGIAGISLPSDSSSRSQEAVARIQSFNFFSNYFLKDIAIEDLVATNGWNSENNRLIYNKKIFIPETAQWIKGTRFSKSGIPSKQEAYKIYLDIINITENKKSSLVTLSVKHHSPFIAKQWTEIIIDKINKIMRSIDSKEVVESMNFLNKKYTESKNENIKKSFSALHEEQLKRMMIIDSNEDYIFEILDPPIVPEFKSEPKRSLMVLLLTSLGFILSTFFSLVLNYRKNL